MYESQRDNGYAEKLSTAGSAAMCRRPPSHFGVDFQPSNDFEHGLGVAVIVDGILCTSKDAAMILVGKRIDDLHQQWTEQISKM